MSADAGSPRARERAGGSPARPRQRRGAPPAASTHGISCRPRPNTIDGLWVESLQRVDSVLAVAVVGPEHERVPNGVAGSMPTRARGAPRRRRRCARRAPPRMWPSAAGGAAARRAGPSDDRRAARAARRRWPRRRAFRGAAAHDHEVVRPLSAPAARGPGSGTALELAHDLSSCDAKHSPIWRQGSGRRLSSCGNDRACSRRRRAAPTGIARVSRG